MTEKTYSQIEYSLDVEDFRVIKWITVVTM